MDMSSVAVELADLQRYDANLLRFELSVCLKDWSLENSRRIVDEHNAKDIAAAIANLTERVTALDFEGLVQATQMLKRDNIF